MTGAHVVVVGAGGNIGSHLVPHVGRMRGVTAVTLIDGGAYEASNVWTQDIGRADIGRAKARVQGRRLMRISGSLHVTVYTERVEALPLAALRGHVVLACLDSRSARQYVNESARRLGVPWIDAAVEGGQLLARVASFAADADAACLECGWDEHDYAVLEQEYPCAGQTPTTGAASSVGALAAALQAIECRKLLDGAARLSTQVLIAAGDRQLFVTRLRRNPECLLVDHAPWRLRRVHADPARLTVAAVLPREHRGREESLAVAGRRFTRRQTCSGCGLVRRQLRFVPGRSTAPEVCRRCGGVLRPDGAQTADALPAGAGGRLRGRTLASLGVRCGDVLVARAGDRIRYVEIAGERT